MITKRRRVTYSSEYFSRLMNTRASPGQNYQPTDVEHLANIISHGVWILPSILVAMFMVSVSKTYRQMAATMVYGSALVLLFTTSTVFHILSYTGRFEKWRRTFHILDRAIIYIFIAASYTPWLLLKEFHSWAEEALVIVWLLALLGVLYAYMYYDRYKFIEIIFYLGLGVCPAISIVDMKDWSGLMELTVGGIMYIAGVGFFKSDGTIPFAHAIWHCFVFVGSFCHFMAICTYLLNADLPVI